MLWLQLRNELWKLFGKKRTYIGFGMLMLAQFTVVLLFRYSKAPQFMLRALESNGYAAAEYITAPTVTVVMLVPIAYVLLPLYLALVGGDLVAKEAEDGTLRMILSRPVTRGRLLLVKWLAGGVFSVALVAGLGIVGLGVARLFFPWGGMFVLVPGEIFGVFEPGAGLRRYVMAHAMLCSKAVTVLSLAFLFSCFNMKPAAATILSLSVLFANFILMQIPFFKELQPWFLTYHLNLWQSMFAQPVPWWRVGESLSWLTALNLTFVAVGAAGFQLRDFKS